MMTRHILLLLSVSLSTTVYAEEPTRPNIVLLLADDLGYGELGCQGNRQIPTPHIDSIAQNGVRFTNGYVTAAYCSSSRAGLLTGRYQTRFGYEFNPIGAHNEHPKAGLPRSERTLARHLHDAGYTTALIGKWHLGGHPQYHPYRRGFDEFFGFTHEGHYFVPPPYRGVTTMLRRRTLPNGGKGHWINQSGTTVYSTHMGYDEPAYDANNPILRGGQPIEEKEYLTDALTREAVDFIDRTKDRPFFLYLAYNAVHSPLQGTDADVQRFAHIPDIHRRIFAAMLYRLDQSVGTVLKKLREEGLEENTVIIFLSDNGGPTRELTSSNKPLRGEKGQVYEGGLRVPFLMQWKGTVPAGMVSDSPVISLDLFPTLSAAAHAPLLPSKTYDGINLLPYLERTEKTLPDRILYWRMNRKKALRAGRWKLVQNASGKWELYDLSADLAESRNLSESHSQQLERLLPLWEKWEAQQQETPLWSRETEW